MNSTAAQTMYIVTSIHAQTDLNLENRFWPIHEIFPLAAFWQLLIKEVNFVDLQSSGPVLFN